MARQSIIDSHIHLWPESMSNEEGHAWMTPGMPLAKEHLLKDYYQACRQPDPELTEYQVDGVLYVETDVRYDTPTGNLLEWVRGPLDEIKFLRTIVEGGHGERDSQMLLGIVAWAPMDQPTADLEEWLRLAEETAGSDTWMRVKGFRFLLQGFQDPMGFNMLVFSDGFIDNLKLLGRRGYAFDVGIDQHSGGSWQLESMAKAMTMAHQGVSEEERVTFILNHLCKPDFAHDNLEFLQWQRAIEMMSKCSKSYMKLSGAFSELPDGLRTTEDISTYLEPWVHHLFASFGPHRVMFGSDWPVCNVKGPKGAESWGSWQAVTKMILDDSEHGLSVHNQDRIWRSTAIEAYGLS